MPWKVTGVMEERMKLGVDWERGEYTKAELCQIYGISQPNGATARLGPRDVCFRPCGGSAPALPG